MVEPIAVTSAFPDSYVKSYCPGQDCPYHGSSGSERRFWFGAKKGNLHDSV